MPFSNQDNINITMNMKLNGENKSLKIIFITTHKLASMNQKKGIKESINYNSDES